MVKHVSAASSPVQPNLDASPKRRAPGRAKVAAIFSATMQLLQEHNPQDITISMVADRARIKRTSVYVHFPNMTAVYEELSERYLRDTHDIVHQFVKDQRPASLEGLLIAVIDGICACFNQMREEDPDGQSGVNRFILHIVVRNFDQLAASFYRTHWTIDWPVAPLSEFDPFRLLVIAQSALFTASIERHGYISAEYADHAKILAVGYIGAIDRKYRPAETQDGGANTDEAMCRIGTAISRIGDPEILGAAAQFMEAIAKRA